MNSAALALAQAERRLIDRCQQLGERIDAGEDLWTEYITTVSAIAALIPPERRPLMTTSEMAERMNVTPKTIRRLGKAGKLEAVRLGQRGTGAIRWRA